MSRQEVISRREFLKQAGLTLAGLGGIMLGRSRETKAQGQSVTRQELVAPPRTPYYILLDNLYKSRLALNRAFSQRGIATKGISLGSPEFVQAGINKATHGPSWETVCEDFHRIASYGVNPPHIEGCEILPMCRQYDEDSINNIVQALKDQPWVTTYLFGNEPNVPGEDSDTKTIEQTANGVYYFQKAIKQVRPDIEVYYVGLGFAAAGLGYLRDVVTYWEEHPEFAPSEPINLHFHMYQCPGETAQDCMSPDFQYFWNRFNFELYKEQFEEIVGYVRSQPDIFSKKIMVSETGVLTNFFWDDYLEVAEFTERIGNYLFNDAGLKLQKEGIEFKWAVLFSDYYEPFPVSAAYYPSSSELTPVGEVWQKFVDRQPPSFLFLPIITFSLPD